jgi:hypothetical protein
VTEPIAPNTAAALLADLGFLSRCDLPDRPGPAYLLVALRPRPTLRHYDPEAVSYWMSRADRGVCERLTRATPTPLRRPFSWGLIRMVDRLQVTNEHLTFGGELVADTVGDDVIGVFTSPAPILRRGGHSQGWDEGAAAVGAFFGRWMLAIDYSPGFEGRAARATPVARYAAFLQDSISRYRPSAALRDEHPQLFAVLEGELDRLRGTRPADCGAGVLLARDVQSVAGVSERGLNRLVQPGAGGLTGEHRHPMRS